jgi:hypothetical protein
MRSVGAAAAGARMALSEQNSHRSIISQPARHSPLDAHSYRSPPRAAAEVLSMPPCHHCTDQAAAWRQGSATAAGSSSSNHSSEALHGFIRQTHSARHMASTHKRTTTLTQLSCSSSIASAQQPCTLLQPPATCQVKTCQPPGAALRTAQQKQQQPKKTESRPPAGPPTLPRKQRRCASQHTTTTPAYTRRAQGCRHAQPALPPSYPLLSANPSRKSLPRITPTPRNQRHNTRPAHTKHAAVQAGQSRSTLQAAAGHASELPVCAAAAVVRSRCAASRRAACLLDALDLVLHVLVHAAQPLQLVLRGVPAAAGRSEHMAGCQHSTQQLFSHNNGN